MKLKGFRIKKSNLSTYSFLIILILVYITIWLLSPPLPHPPECEFQKQKKKALHDHLQSFDLESNVEKFDWKFFHSQNQWYDCFGTGTQDRVLDQQAFRERVEKFKQQGDRPVVVMLKKNSVNRFLPLTQYQRELINCTIPCHFVVEDETYSHPKCQSEVDGFVFHPSEKLPPPPPPSPEEGLGQQQPNKIKKIKEPYQSFILHYNEPEYVFPVLSDFNFRKNFDIEMSYHMESEVPVLPSIDIFETHNWRANAFKPNAETNVLLIMNEDNCNANKKMNVYLRELMNHIKIHSVGSCFQNKIVDSKIITSNFGSEVRIKLISEYKFIIIIESFVESDYVSDILFESFIAGAIPVYLGSPNVDHYIPSHNSIIKIENFRKAEDLANYIHSLLGDPRSLREFLKWKKIGFSRNFFHSLRSLSLKTAACRLCKAIAKKENDLRKKDQMKLLV